MTATAVEDRKVNAAEYLELLRSLVSEMEKAMQAIAHNALPDLEESVASQQIISARLLLLADEISPSLKSSPSISPACADADLMHQVMVAGDTLQKLNRRYAALLQHSSRSVALMASLFSSYQGQFKEASGPRLKHQTWSCQM
jgi:uncharacterized protein with NRDE domain